MGDAEAIAIGCESSIADCPLLTTTNTYAKIQLINQPIKNSMTPNIIVISVIRDFAMYDKCIANNPFCKDLLKHPIQQRLKSGIISL